MKKYKFIFKPLFFIFNLLFATWLVFRIEEISPSDFGKYKTLFDEPPLLTPNKTKQKQNLINICAEYRAGVLDSSELVLKLDKYLVSVAEVSNK